MQATQLGLRRCIPTNDLTHTFKERTVREILERAGHFGSLPNVNARGDSRRES